MGYDQVLLFGIYRFHKTGETEQGELRIDTLFGNHRERLTNEQRKTDVKERYERYTEWCRQAGVAVADYRIILKGGFNGFMDLGGFLHRVDGTAAGVRGIVLGNYSPSWRSELRMPLIQMVLAERYGVPGCDVSVGVQRPDGSGLREQSFDPMQLREARRQFRAIGEYVRRRWRQ